MQQCKSIKKTYLIILLILALGTALLAGCAKETSSTSPEDTSADEVTPSPAMTPIATTQPDVTPTPEPSSAEDDEDAMAKTYNGWIYYLDVNDPIVVEYSEDPPLHMKEENGETDKKLDIRGFNFDIIGDYIYIDSNDLDIDETGLQTWSTTRINLDGSNIKKLEYGSMSARLVPEGEQKFYFTTLGDCAIYVSDFACEQVLTIAVTLPDKEELDKKLGTGNILQMSISEISDGHISFDVTVSADDGTILYSGSYKTTVVGTSTERISGTYYEYGSQENE